MSGKVEEFEKGIEQSKFDEIIGNNKLVLVDIYTTWCGPCKFMKPIFKDLAEVYKGKVTFLSIDLDESRWLGSHPDYGTDAIPTFLFIKDKKLVEKKIGGGYKDDFIKLIEEKLLKD